MPPVGNARRGFTSRFLRRWAGPSRPPSSRGGPLDETVGPAAKQCPDRSGERSGPDDLPGVLAEVIGGPCRQALQDDVDRGGQQHDTIEPRIEGGLVGRAATHEQRVAARIIQQLPDALLKQVPEESRERARPVPRLESETACRRIVPAARLCAYRALGQDFHRKRSDRVLGG